MLSLLTKITQPDGVKTQNETDYQTSKEIAIHFFYNLVISKQFGTNEYKLKYGFKQLYGITVFRYLTQERLKRASLLIQNTSLSIKAVAKMTGSKMYHTSQKPLKIILVSNQQMSKS